MNGVIIMRGDEKGKTKPNSQKTIPIGEQTTNDVPDSAIKTLLEIFIEERNKDK